MFGSETLEVAIGLAVLFSFMSLFATAFRETLEAWFKQRARLVHKALAQLFSEDGSEDSPTLEQFYNSIVISPLFRGTYKGVKGDLPSYITSANFVSALYDVGRRQAGAGAGAKASEWTGKIGDARLSELINLAFQVGSGDPQKAGEFLEHWYDTQMERVSGWYKRSTHWILLIFGFLTALALNVDAIAIVHHLYRNDAVREIIVARASATAASAAVAAPGTVPSRKVDRPKNGAAKNDGEASAVGPNTDRDHPSGSSAPDRAAPSVAAASHPAADEAQGGAAAQVDRSIGELRGYGFPIGWSWTAKWPTPVPQCGLRGLSDDRCSLASLGWSGFFLLLVGWAITAFAISLGAPFWFDLLNKFMVIRSTVKPFEKSQPEGSEDRKSTKVHDPVAAAKPDPDKA